MTEAQTPIKPIIFLDFDGPLIPTRMYYTKKNTDRMVAEFDPAAVSMIERVAELADAQYVISSSWRSLGEKVISLTLQLNGMSLERVHKDWQTPRKFSETSRAYEIGMWLKNHPEVTTWAAIDDEPIHLKYPNNTVRVTMDNGFLFEHYNRLREILGLKTSSLVGI